MATVWGYSGSTIPLPTVIRGLVRGMSPWGHSLLNSSADDISFSQFLKIVVLVSLADDLPLPWTRFYRVMQSDRRGLLALARIWPPAEELEPIHPVGWWLGLFRPSSLSFLRLTRSIDLVLLDQNTRLSLSMHPRGCNPKSLERHPLHLPSHAGIQYLAVVITPSDSQSCKAAEKRVLRTVQSSQIGAYKRRPVILSSSCRVC